MIIAKYIITIPFVIAIQAPKHLSIKPRGVLAVNVLSSHAIRLQEKNTTINMPIKLTRVRYLPTGRNCFNMPVTSV